MRAGAGEPRLDLQLERLLRLVRARTGLVYGADRHGELVTRIAAAMRRAGYARAAEYRAALLDDSRLFDDLLTELTVGETYFWREPGQLEFMRREVLPSLRPEGATAQPLRVWSAGCASGEEAYSLAILLTEAGLEGSATVLGTDLSPARLELARRGEYSRWSLRGVPAEIANRWFRQGENGRHRVDPALRKMVRFRELNLAEEEYPSPGTEVWAMDLVLCRNVLIYLDRSTVKRVAERLLASLSEEGWLFLGASDPMLNEFVPCEVVVTGAGVAYRRSGRREAESSPRRWWTRSQPAAPARPAPLPPEPARTRAARPAVRAEPAADAGSVRDAAVTRYREGDNAGVLELLRGARSGDPGEELRVLEVRSLANLGANREALAACDHALQDHRGSAELTYLRGTLLTALGSAAEAVPVLRAALYLDRSLIMAHLALAQAYRLLADRGAAVSQLRAAERLLSACETQSVVPASDGLDAGSLLDACRLQIRLLGDR